MALSKSTITGRVPLPTDENLQFAELTFALSGLDTEGASVLPGGVSTRAVLVGSDIPAGFELWQNTAGLRGTHYRVLARWTVKDRDGVRDQYADLGIIQVGSDPSYTLADLINNGVPPAIGTFWSAITQAQYDAVIQAAADALASATAAALYDPSIRFMTVAAMLASSEASRGVGVVWRGGEYGYQEVAPATPVVDGYPLVTAGGVKLEVMGKRVEIDAIGTVGAGASDNLLLKAALQSGKPVVGFGPEYKFDKYISTIPGSITFGKNTIVKNVQASGAKVPAIQFIGAGLQGSVKTITAINGASGSFDPKNTLIDTVTVDDVAGLAVGDLVRVSENAAFAMETNTSAPTMQDFNTWCYHTIFEITGNDIRFEEYIRVPFDTARSLKLQKVVLLEDVHIRGGKHVGGVASGGGIGLDYCRRSTINGIRASGISYANPSGGDSVFVTNCWECSGNTFSAWRTTFATRWRFNQSCQFSKMSAKRTTNGGHMFVSNIFCHFLDIVNDSAGDDNGDGIGLHSANKFCTFGPITLSGDNCYGAWIKQPSTDNVFLPITSISGVTACILCIGDRNTFQKLEVYGNGGSGISIEANDVTVNWIDFVGPGAGFRVRSGYANPYIRGRSKSTGSDTFAWDGVIGSITGADINFEGGPRGLSYQSADRNETNNITARGPNPVFYGRNYRGRGWAWATEVLGINSTAQAFKIPGGPLDVGGLKVMAAPSGDESVSYLITLQARTNFATASSQYQLMGRQNTWFLTEVRKGVSSFAPILQINGSQEVEILTASGTAAVVYALVEKF